MAARFAYLVAFVLTACSAAAARAADPAADGGDPGDPADRAIERGIELRRRGRDAEALAEFTAAIALRPSPRALGQVGLAEAALQRWASAESDLSRVLATDDAWVDRTRGALRVALDLVEHHLGSLQVSGASGAELWLGQALYGRLPQPFIRVPVGPLRVELRLSGREADSRDVEIREGEVTRVTFEEAPAPSPPVDSPSSPAPPARPAGELSLPPPRAPLRQRPTRPSLALWMTSTGSAAFLLAGVASTLYEGDRAARYNDDHECGDTPSEPRSARCSSVARQFQLAQAAAVTSYALAGAGAAVSVALWANERGRDRARSPAASWRCAPLFVGGVCAIAF